MKRIVVSIISIIILCLGLTSCQQVKIPEGIDNKVFYKDMVKCLDLTEKALKFKNTKYADDIDALIVKNTEKDILKTLAGILNENYGLNNKEQKILINTLLMNKDLKQYLRSYFNSNTIDTSIMIDVADWDGEFLLKSIQETINSMDIDYEFENE